MDLFSWVGEKLQDLLDSFLKLFPSSPILYLTTNSQIRTFLGYVSVCNDFRELQR